nr:hypothetical protein [Bradyrhizobium sp. Oc8]
MLRFLLAALAALVLISVSLVPDDAYARRGGGFHGGGMRAGGFHGGGARVAHVRGGGHRVAGGRYGVAGRGYGYRPIPGRPVARAAVARGVYRNAAYRGAYRGAAYGLGAAAVGAAAAGAYGYYNNSNCYYDTYGNQVCPGQYPYGYRY